MKIRDHPSFNPLWAGSYWSNYKWEDEFEEVLFNRNIFALDMGVKRRFISGTSLFVPLNEYPLDHGEVYSLRGRKKMIMYSPYGYIGKNDDYFGRIGFDRYPLVLYSKNCSTYYRVFENVVELNKFVKNPFEDHPRFLREKAFLSEWLRMNTNE